MDRTDTAGAANLFVALVNLAAGILAGSSAMLVVAAIRLGADNRELLIGKAADPGQLSVIRSQIEAAPGVSAVLDLLTMYPGPDHLIVAARVAFDDDISADRAEDVADSIDARLTRELPVIPHVFLDPTQLHEDSAPALRR
jgi:divalent metal cation (Fe/Co/Zn/Cd) transporter